MAVVIDTNIILAVILGEPEKELIKEATTGEELLAPAVLPFEVANAFSRMAKRFRLERSRISRALDIYMRIPVRLIEADLRQAMMIALDHNIYAYDAFYLETAGRLKLRLLTLDLEMRRIAADIGIRTVELSGEGL